MNGDLASSVEPFIFIGVANFYNILSIQSTRCNPIESPEAGQIDSMSIDNSYEYSNLIREMASCLSRNNVRKCCALVAAMLILPSLAHAGEHRALFENGDNRWVTMIGLMKTAQADGETTIGTMIRSGPFRCSRGKGSRRLRAVTFKPVMMRSSLAKLAENSPCSNR